MSEQAYKKLKDIIYKYVKGSEADIAIKLLKESNEYYHQRRVNAISDEIINEKSFNLEKEIAVRQAYNKGAKWFKNKLLNK